MIADLEICSLISHDIVFNATDVEKSVQRALTLAVEDRNLSSIPVDPERVQITSIGLGNVIAIIIVVTIIVLVVVIVIINSNNKNIKNEKCLSLKYCNICEHREY